MNVMNICVCDRIGIMEFIAKNRIRSDVVTGFDLMWYILISFGNFRIISNTFRKIYYGSISVDITRSRTTRFPLGLKLEERNLPSIVYSVQHSFRLLARPVLVRQLKAC